ncbi:MAG: hypothetical protein KJ057_02990 [Phycisphaerae bacterium]|nr:MAG: hypothetical protein EDS66_01870 [Planctomycetota bacterium]KAB2949864.1 MAG: hypothetical protein F9K17_01445 [Phycisphaerae bacterium]MBE7457616.1 hypothetical protein [Planctomycetia bacterium]MCK6463868.1 hypothetical protein [Phycisphaerae bacterium]MCL4717418.1 hypothetical protein [Phycisphaerae bacterium]
MLLSLVSIVAGPTAPLSGLAALGVEQDASAPSPSPATAIEFLHRPACVVVLREHDGPPWTLGRTLTEFARYRATVPGAGPVFIMHPAEADDQPGHEADSGGEDRRPATGVLQVGFFVERPIAVEPPCRVEHWEDGSLARWTVGGPAWRTRARIQEFLRRIKAAGHEPVGTVIELASEASPGGTDETSVTLEAALRPQAPPLTNSAPAAQQSGGARTAALTGRAPKSATPDPSAQKPADPAPSRAEPASPDPVSNEARELRDNVLGFLDGVGKGTTGVDEAPWLFREDSTGNSTERGNKEEAGSTAGRVFLEGDFKASAERLLPASGRYGKARRIDVARAIDALERAGKALSESDTGASRDFARLVKALRQQASRIRLDLPKLDELDTRSQVRLIEADDALGRAITALSDAVRDARSRGAESNRCHQRAATLLDLLEGSP